MRPTTAILVRAGIDATFGGWNAPADPVSREFVYVPIPEPMALRPGHEIRYPAVVPALHRFCGSRKIGLERDLRFPPGLHDAPMHLDPDFDFLTYGDNGARRGSQIRLLRPGDLLAFYAGLRSIGDGTLIYALIGMLTVSEIVTCGEVPSRRLGENAHTRRLAPDPAEFVVRGVPGQSGRLACYLPIGERRDGAYRVRRDLLEEWGGLSVRDGFIQRSARPPRFLQAPRFLSWLGDQNVSLMRQNNPDPSGESGAVPSTL